MNQLSEFAAVVRKGEELQQAEAESGGRHAANFFVVCTPARAQLTLFTQPSFGHNFTSEPEPDIHRHFSLLHTDKEN